MNTDRRVQPELMQLFHDLWGHASEGRYDLDVKRKWGKLQSMVRSMERRGVERRHFDRRREDRRKD